jgi:diguanylate cyclase (GGDEF)-like protein
MNPLSFLEHHRLDALQDYDIIGMVPDQAYLDLVNLISLVCITPIAMINIIDAERQHSLVANGVPGQDIPRSDSVCAHLLYSPNERLVVSDLQEDDRFCFAPMVRDKNGLRGYAAVPLVTQDGYVLGTLCVCDREPRHFTDDQLEALRVVGFQVSQMLEARRNYMKYQESQQRLEDMLIQLHLLSIDDELTGLLNRRALDAKIEEEIKRAGRGNLPISFLMIDVDHFKSYNDTYGHPAGDIVLRSVADALKMTARQHDAVGRYGGEEFAVIMPMTDAAGAQDAAERFRTAVETLVHGKRRITVSVGVASWAPGMFPMDIENEGARLMSLADRGLYRAKSLGRNQVGMLAPDADLETLAPDADLERAAA